MRNLLLKLCKREDLTRDEAREAFIQIMSGEATEAQVGGLLIGLAAKGTTVDELVGAATVMREKSVPIACDGEVVLDTCGTGGSRLRSTGLFNISTTAALIVAGAGVKVVKHGNRSASSRSGSADVLEKLGVNLDRTPEQLSASLKHANICFAFARAHHPAMKHVAGARASLGVPTIFNMLGPLSNPAKAKHQLLGVFAPELTSRFAQVLRDLGSTRAWVVHAEDGLDEISTLGPTQIADLENGHIRSWTLDPMELGMSYGRLSDLQVSSVEESADAIRGILSGVKGPRRDIAVLNAAAALVVAGKAPEIGDGITIANDSIDSRAAQTSLESLIRQSQLN
jgi:anthranilate phosphoribosyltransferase